MEHYTGTLAEMEALDAQICSNCSWPDNNVVNWATPSLTVVSNVYAIEVPQGSHGFTKEQQNVNVSSTIHTNVKFPTED